MTFHAPNFSVRNTKKSKSRRFGKGLNRKKDRLDIKIVDPIINNRNENWKTLFGVERGLLRTIESEDEPRRGNHPKIERKVVLKV
jgi:hypothetical protein